jgi:hypothetical protein
MLSSRRRRLPRLLLRNRRGVTLVLAMIMAVVMGALAMAAIYLNSSAGLIGRMSEREKELRYAADFALQVGKSVLNNDPTSLPDSGYRTLVSNGLLTAANGAVIPGVSYHLYAGPTGSTTGQFGRFASVVSDAMGPGGARFVRRLELEQESFARYAYWSNLETDAGGGIIYFGGGDVLWGPVWSNSTITIHSTGATFNDDVSTAQVINQASYATFKKGYKENQHPITLPTVTALSKLAGYATSGSFNFNAPTSGGQTTVRMRIEFLAVDLNSDGDSTDVDEGFLRVYTANSGEVAWLRGDWNTNKSNAENCGDYHKITVAGTNYWRFYPAAVHGTGGSTSWARTQWQSGGMTSGQASTHGGLNVDQIMSAAPAPGQPPSRCYPGGDPHLVAIERNALGGNAAGQKGGEDSTFTPTGGDNGSWTPWTGAIDSRVLMKRPWDANYLFPLHRALNTGTKGVIQVNGTVAVSGVLRGRYTLYSTKTVVLLDDQRYAIDPAGGICQDMLGVISGDNVVVADNGINSPQNASGYKYFDDTKDLYLHGVVMTLNESFTVENYNAGPTDANDCGTTNWGRGCLFLTGGVIQQRRGAVGTSSGTGFLKRYSYDRCVLQIPPPYFPTTGRFLDNRYSEIDPPRFNVAQLFASLTPTP